MFNCTARSVRRLAVLVWAATMASAASAQTMPDWFNMTTGRGFRKDIPDFYQHQYNGDAARPNWQRNSGTGGGWCRPTALANCLYSWKVNGFPNLLPNSPNINMNGAGNWQPDACRAIEDLQNVQGAGIQTYLNDRGYGETNQPGQGLKFTQYNVNGTSGAVTYRSSDGSTKNVAGTAFDLYKKELKDGQDVLIRWSAALNLDNSLWWRGNNPDGGNYHFVTGAGIDCGTTANPKRVIYFADPDSNKGSAGGNAGWNFTPNDAGVNGRKYGPGDNAVPVPGRGANMNDDPVNFNQFYGCTSFAADGFTVDPADATNERYRGVKIRAIETICPTKATTKASTPAPTPSSPNRTSTRMDFGSGFINDIDAILLFPSFSLVSPFSPIPSIDSSFVDPSADTWFKQYLDPSAPDPDGNLRGSGGIFFSTLGALSAGELAFTDVLTESIFASFDVLMHLKGTPLTLGDGSFDGNGSWFRQAIGSEEYLLGDQIPAPGALSVLMIGGVMTARRRRV